MEKLSPPASKIYLYWSLLLVTVFIVVYPKFPLLNIYGTYVAVRIEDLAIAGLSLYWLLQNIKNLKKILSVRIIQIFILFWFISFVSTLSAIFITQSVAPHIGLLHWLRRVEVMMLFLITATTISSFEQIKLFLKVMLVVTLLVVFYGFGQIYLSFPVVSTTNKEFSKGLLLTLTPGARANSTFAGHYDLAIYLSLAITFLGSIFLHYKRLKYRLIIAVSAGVSFILLGLTAARVSFVATLLGLVFIFWMNGKKLLVAAVVVLSILMVGAIPELRHRLVATITVNLLEGGGPKYTPDPSEINVFTPGNQIPEASRAAIFEQQLKDSTEAAKTSTVSADIAPGEPVNTTELGVYRSFNIRFDVEWPRAIMAFIKNPIWGTGYSSITLATDNDYLRSLGETGILGTISLGLIFLAITQRMIRKLKTLNGLPRLLIVATVCSLLVLGLTAVFIDVLEASKIASLTWIMLGLAWAVAGDFKYED